MFENTTEMVMDTVEAPVMDADVEMISDEIASEPMIDEDEMENELPVEDPEQRKLSKAEVAGLAGLAAGALYIGVRAYKKHKEKAAQSAGDAAKRSWKDKIPTIKFQAPVTFVKKESAPVAPANPDPVPANKQDEQSSEPKEA